MLVPVDICNNILRRSFDDRHYITPLTLQKLLYFTYARYFANTGKVLFREPFEAWTHGPVIPSVYKTFKDFAGNPISEYGRDFRGVHFANENQSTVLQEVIEKVWDTYKDMDGYQLRDITHRDGCAWKKAVESGGTYLNLNDIMLDVREGRYD